MKQGIWPSTRALPQAFAFGFYWDLTRPTLRIEAGRIDLRRLLAGLHHSRNQPFSQVSCDLGERPVTVVMDQVWRVFTAGQIQQLVGIGGEVVNLMFLVTHAVWVAVSVAAWIDNAISPLIGAQRPGHHRGADLNKRFISPF